MLRKQQKLWQIKRNIIDMEDLESDDEFEDAETIDKVVHCEQSSIITDKYKEDMDARTVANKFADLIIDIECQRKNNQTNKGEPTRNVDYDELFYSEDETFQSEDEEDDEDECDGSEVIQLKSEEKTLLKKFTNIQKDYPPFLVIH